MNYQQRDAGRESNDGETTKERVGSNSSDDGKETGGTTNDVGNLSCVDSLNVELFNQIYDEIGSPAAGRKCQASQGTCDEGEGDPAAGIWKLRVMRLMVTGE